MLSGGSFEDMFDVEAAAAGPFLWIFLASVVFLGVRSWIQWRRGLGGDDAASRGRSFVLVTTLLSLAGMLLMPGAERIHHVLNAYPFPQLTVAMAVIELWRLGGERSALSDASRAGTALRGAAVVTAGCDLRHSGLVPPKPTASGRGPEEVRPFQIVGVGSPSGKAPWGGKVAVTTFNYASK